ncbi:isochorismatase family protein [Enterobacteriales bacterium SAP-6]|uniref:Isochorismatase family protein n=2 Tax=Acerihabitans arboris TaxID=2691583 RepID=A0A845SD37_9GAMM|nr:isochorismatase family protein [Acerihabitans arboris]
MTTALLFIDVQNHILHGLGSPERQPLLDRRLDEVVGRLAVLRQRASAAGVQVILVQHDGDGGYRLATGGEGWKIRRELSPVEGDIVVHKRSCDSFFATDLAGHLQRLGVTRLVVGGCMTQFCVDTTVRRAVSMGYDVTLAGDGHTTADSGALSFEQIIAHHNALLNGFNAGPHLVEVCPAAAIAL